MVCENILVMLLMYVKVELLVMSCCDKYFLKHNYGNFMNEYQNVMDV